MAFGARHPEISPGSAGPSVSARPADGNICAASRISMAPSGAATLTFERLKRPCSDRAKIFFDPTLFLHFFYYIRNVSGGIDCRRLHHVSNEGPSQNTRTKEKKMICPRCKKDVSSWCLRKCTNCGTVYCNLCSTRSEKDIADGTMRYNCDSTQCPTCGQRKGEKLSF